MRFCCSITIGSDTRYLAPLRDWIGAAAKITGRGLFPKRARIACTLALIESVDNAILHAHRRARTKPIGISLRVSEMGISLEVVDRGRGLGHHSRLEPEITASRGRGLFLIHRLMSRVESRMKNGRHSLKMIYKI